MSAALLVVSLAGVTPQAAGWVLGARTSPFAELSRTGPGSEDLRLFGNDPSPSGLGLLRHQQSGPRGGGSYAKRSSDDQLIRLCGDMLDKVIRFTCRNYWEGRGKRSVGSALDDLAIAPPEEFKVTCATFLNFLDYPQGRSKAN